jgi:sugar phosphate isomerase/epimerase
MMNRRNFLGAVTIAALAQRLAWANEVHKVDRIGIEAYTIRDLLDKDFDGTLEKIAAIGFKEIEFGPTIKDPNKTRATLDRLGMTSPSGAFAFEDMSRKWPEVLDHCQIMGHHYIVIGSIDGDLRNQPDGWQRGAEAFNRTGAVTSKSGILVMYHCHWREFVPMADGRVPYEILLKETDPRYVQMEMDLGWTNIGGADPLDWFARYPGRFPLVHVKDFRKLPDRKVVYGGKFDGDQVIPDMTEIGKGVIDWKRIFAHSEQAGIKHYYVEHDLAKDPMEYARASFRYLNDLRF